MKKVLLIAIILLAIALRLYALGSNPPSLDWDEASLGYNAYSLLKTGKDEYGKILPINLTSFGDYKPAGYVYLAIPAIALFGLNEFSIRFPSAVIGVLTVQISFWLIRELFQKSPKRSIYALLTAFFLAISPWHIQFSRVAFEANVGLFFFVLGSLLFLLSLRKRYLLPLTAVAYVFSLYSYHATRLVVPLFLCGLIVYCKDTFRKARKWFIISFIVGLVLLLPLAHAVINEAGNNRFNAVTQFKPTEKLNAEIKNQLVDRNRSDWLGVLIHNRRVSYTKSFLAGYLDHFDLSFLFIKGDEYKRHNASGMGLLYYWDFLFVIVGIGILLRNNGLPQFFLLWWFLVSPVASALTAGTPHAVRALLTLPTYQLFTALGVIATYDFLRQKREWYRIGSLLIFGSLIINIFYYLDVYFIHTPIDTSQYWQYGYKQLVAAVKKEENTVSSVLITNTYDQPYIYFLLYKPIDPIWYQTNWIGQISQEKRTLLKYEFRAIDWEKDQYKTNTLFALSPKEVEKIPIGQLTPMNTIHFLDGSVAFYLIKR